MAIPFKTLEYMIEKEIEPQLTDVQRTLNTLPGVKLSAKEAREALARIQNHKWYISERLGRDVGLRVAAIDYFENIYEPPVVRNESGTITQRLQRLAKDLLAIYLAHQSWKAHDGIFFHSPQDFIWPELWDESLRKDTRACSELMRGGVRSTMRLKLI